MIQSDVDANVHWILATLGDQLPGVDHQTIKDLIKYGEWALAVETLCDQMAEREVAPSKEVYERIMSVVSKMRIDDRYRRAVPLPAKGGAAAKDNAGPSGESV